MKRRMIALLLALAIVSAIAVSAFAAETAEENKNPAPAGEPAVEAAAETDNQAAAPEKTSETTQPAAESTAAEEVPEATEEMILFAELEELVKKHSYSYKTVMANLGYMDDLQDNINKLQKAISTLDTALSDPSLDDATRASLEAKRASYLQQKLSLQQQDPGSAIPKLRAGGYQVIMGCESVFIALVGMERQEAALERQLAALDRTVKEMELRAEMGQVSQLQMVELQTGRGSLVSGLSTLRMNISNYKMQLEQMIGEEMTGTTVLGTLPAVTEEQLNALNLEEDLKIALRKNLNISSANAAEANAYELADQMPGMDMGAMMDAANYTYRDAKLQTELKFRQMYAQIQDYRQVLAAQEAALEYEKLAYQAEELKYQQGTISKNALLTAEDELKTAQEAVQTAKDNLFSAYNNYRWAVDHGVLS